MNNRAKWLLVLSLYSVFLIMATLYAPEGQNVGVLSAPPSILAAWFFGIYPGLAFSVFSVSWIVGTFLYFGRPDAILTPPTLVGGGMSFFLSLAVGWTRSLHKEHMRELQRRAEIEHKLREARAAADQANQKKSQFIATMSHELRTPLSSILGYAELLLEDAENDGLDDYTQDLTRIVQAGEHLVSMMDQILDLSRIEAGRFSLHATRINAHTLCSGLESTLMSLIKKHDNTLEMNVPDITLHHDETRLRQVLLNLLTNACKFTQKGTITLSCSTLLHEDQDWVRFDIKDTGVGMDAQDLKVIFNEFQRVGVTRNDASTGTGLGLNIVKRLAHMMGGHLEVSSTKGVGSTFSLLIPQDLNAYGGKSS